MRYYIYLDKPFLRTILGSIGELDFDIDVSGVRELSFEYNGICDMTDILFGMSDAKLYS